MTNAPEGGSVEKKCAHYKGKTFVLKDLDGALTETAVVHGECPFCKRNSMNCEHGSYDIGGWWVNIYGKTVWCSQDEYGICPTCKPKEQSKCTPLTHPFYCGCLG